MTWTAGIDVGGTNLKAVAVTTNGTVLRRFSLSTHDSSLPRNNWGEHAHAAIAQLEADVGSAAATVGVGAPGLAAPDGRSSVELPGKLAGIAGLDWTVALKRAAVVPVLNDAHAAVMGEAWLGAARERRHVVLLTLGTGVGGAVISDGRLLRGAIGRAGHIGHMSLDPEGTVSITGMPGAIETMIGDCTVAARTSGKFSDTAALVTAHLAGDADATRVWLRSVRALACAIGSCINLFDPEIVVVGGGIAQAAGALFGPLQRELDQIEWRPAGRAVPVVPAELGEWAGAIGAARNSFSS